MATEFPIEQEYGRFVPGMPDQPDDTQDEEMEFDLPDESAEIEELPDGSAIVSMETEGPLEDGEFYENLAEKIDALELDSIAMRYIELIEKDKKAREERDKQYEEGLKRTGLGKDAPGGATFMGASKVVHPVMAEACVDFASRAIKEMFPPDGPVKTKILGQVDEEKTARAERKRDFMNWQLTEQIEELRRAGTASDAASAGWQPVPQALVRRGKEAPLRRVPAHRPCDRALCGHELLHRPAGHRSPRHHRVGVQASHPHWPVQGHQPDPRHDAARGVQGPEGQRQDRRPQVAGQRGR